MILNSKDREVKLDELKRYVDVDLHADLAILRRNIMNMIRREWMLIIDFLIILKRNKENTRFINDEIQIKELAYLDLTKRNEELKLL